MKKKFIGRLSAMLIAVLCVCLLCVPAMASTGEQGELVEVLPETAITLDDLGEVSIEPLPFIVGNTYIVNWNGVDYECIVQDLSAMVGDECYTLGNHKAMGMEDTGEPFIISSMPSYGIGVIGAFDGSTELTISIYQAPLSQSELLFSNITTYVDALRIQLSATSVIEVLAYIAGIAVLGVFLWWGVRKAVKGIKSAFLRGKLRL